MEKLFAYSILGLSYCMVGCNDHKDHQPTYFISPEEVSSVIKSVIEEDSFLMNRYPAPEIIVNNRTRDTVVSNLVEEHFPPKFIDTLFLLSKADSDTSPPPPPGSSSAQVDIENLLEVEIEEHRFFQKTDSSALIQQLKNIREYTLTDSDITFIDCISRSEVSKIQRGKSIYHLSVPLFSKDKNRAYLQVNYFCGPRCGYGNEYFMEKISGAWKICKVRKLWIS